MSDFDFRTSFPPLGHPEHHFNRHPNHSWLKTEKQVFEWMVKNVKLSLEIPEDNNWFIINNDLTVSTYHNNIEVIGLYNENVIPVQFRDSKNFKCENKGLRTILGVPYSAEGYSLSNNEINELQKIRLVDYKVPDFNLKNNPISSWGDFEGVKVLWWWQDEWCDKTSYDLLMKTPKSVLEIRCSPSFKDDKVKLIVGNGHFIDMKWIREEQRVNEINNNYMNMNINLNNIENNKNKRKI